MNKREALRRKIKEKQIQRTSRNTIIQKMDKAEKKQSEKIVKEEKNLTIEDDMPPLEEF
jgi:hypothetical protein|tara:strand:+ start:513 stop:689 length:177 start_codon:yes stop_codon:yes gene_type:complete